MTGPSFLFRPGSLFGRTALGAFAALMVFQVIILGITSYFILAPILRNSVEDLAAFMLRTAEHWLAAAPADREAIAKSLVAEHDLWIESPATDLQGERSLLPYVWLLERALSRRSGTPAEIRTHDRAGTWYSADFAVAGNKVRYRFKRDRIGTRPPLAMGLTVVAALLLSLVFSLWLARRVTRPLNALAVAVDTLGQGRQPLPIPETRPTEVAVLARAFNRMSGQVQELLDNRTTLLAGVSHDLRTPIARMRLAVELLRDRGDERLLQDMEKDLEQMNGLIGQFLDMSRGLKHVADEPVALDKIIADVVEAARRGGAHVVCSYDRPCIKTVNELGLRRVLGNLLDNAVRYGGSGPVELRLTGCDSEAVIEVADRGPGIPDDRKEAVLRPFVRLEQSRNRETGGSGLGLAIAHQIAQAQGWRLLLLNREGGGTVARVVL